MFRRFLIQRNASKGVSLKKSQSSLRTELAIAKERENFEKERGMLNVAFEKERGLFEKDREKERGMLKLEKERGIHSIEMELVLEKERSKMIKSKMIADLQSHSIRAVIGKYFFNIRGYLRHQSTSC